MRNQLAILILCLAVLTAFSGCAKTIVLYPQTDQDIYQDGKGFTCVSDVYMQEVMKARLGK